ncbi:MAG: formimidoylglutamase, partial [Bacteroidota bacterium]
MTTATDYQSVDPTIWRGRESAPNQYWYQRVKCLPWTDYLQLVDNNRPQVVILGYAVDEGVRRNQGRIGAAAGPDAIRPLLATLADHLPDGLDILDLGNVYCPNGQLGQTQLFFATKLTELKSRGSFPVLLGGGHDIAYAHYQGIQKYLLKIDPAAKLGIINLDAHFDLRQATNGPTSGTPFYQMATDALDRGEQLPYLCLGIQRAANTRELFEYASSFGVDFIEAKDFV